MAKDVMILTGAGQIGMAIARRMGHGMKIVIGDRYMKNARAVRNTMNLAGFDSEAVEMDLSSRESIRAMLAKAKQYGNICQCSGCVTKPSICRDYTKSGFIRHSRVT